MMNDTSSQALENIEGNIEIKIKIRTLDNEFQVHISSENKVEELKKRIENISRVPIDRQRLIFRGKLLKDNEILSLYKIAEMDVIHLVAKTGDQIDSNSNNEENAMNSDSNNTNRGNRRENSLFSLMNRLIRLDNEESGTSSNTNSSRPMIIPAIMGRRMRRGSSNENSRDVEFNSIECREAILQNLSSMNNLIECSSSQEINLSNQTQSQSKELFNFKNKKLYKGQWVDVKDTIEQWLEAQVIDIKDNQIYVHYNGWGTRWDEWIDMDSDRIRPFRFHTRQTVHSNYQSPFPQVKPDANVSLESNISMNESFFNIFEEVEKSYQYADNIMKEIKEKKKENNIKSQKDVFRLSKNLAPFLDKLGRTITDIGGYINTSMRNNKLEDLDKKLYESKNLDSSLKPYDQNEVYRVELEEAAKRSRRESGANILIPVNIYDREITSQVPLIDSSLYIQNTRQSSSTPMVDIYVQTFYSPLTGRGASANVPPSNQSNNSAPSERPSIISRNPFDILLGNQSNINNQENNINQDNSNTITNTGYNINLQQTNVESSNILDIINNNSNNPNSVKNTDSSNSFLIQQNNENEFLGNKRKKSEKELEKDESELNIIHKNLNDNLSHINSNLDNRNDINEICPEPGDIIIEEYFENESNLNIEPPNNLDENNSD